MALSVANAGSLNFVLSANSAQLRQELGKVRQESQATASAVVNLFSGDTINAVGFRIVRGTVTGLINDIDELNNGLTLTESLTRNLAASFNDLGDIALLQLGQIAQFLGDDLFDGPLADFQQGALENIGLGQLSGAFQIVSAGANAAKLAEPALAGLASGFSAIDDVLGGLQGNASAASDFFKSIGGNAKLVSTILIAVADSIDEAIEQFLDTLAEINPAFKVVRDGAKALGIEFSVGKSFLGEYVDNLKAIEQTADGASKAFGDVADAAGNIRGGVGNANDSIDDFAKKLAQQRKAAEQAEEAMRDLGEAGVFFDSYLQASGIIDSFFGSFEQNFNAAKDFENLTNRLQSTSKAAGGANEDLQFLNEITDELGLNFNSSAEGFAQFSAATQQTNLDAAETKEIFEDVAQSAAVMRLSAADTEGVFFALRQTISGGNVSLEELNQLAERVPGAFQAAEAALRQLGYEYGSVKDIISTGDVDAESFVPVFAQQLAATTQSGVVGAAGSAEAAVNRFNNSLSNLQIAMGQTWVEVGAPALNVFADALQFAAENEELLSTAIDALLVASMFRGISAVVGFTKAIFTSGATVKLFGQQITLTAKQIGSYALQAGLAYAATLVFYRVLDRLKSGAESTQTSIAALEASLAEIRNIGQEEEVAIVPEDPPPLDWLDVYVDKISSLREDGGLLGDILASALEAPVAPAALLNKSLNFLRTGEFELVTNAEKQLNDLLVSIGDFNNQAQEIIGESIQFRTEVQGGDSALDEIRRIEAQLKQIEEQKLTLEPGDEAGLEQLKAQEDELLKRRGDAQKEIQAIGAALNNALAQAQQQLQAIDPSKLGVEGAQQAKAQLEAQIAQIEREKEAFDELASSATNAAETISQSFAQSSATLEKEFLDQQVAIAESLAAGGVTEDQAREQNLEAERRYLEEKVALNQEKLQELQTELERNARLREIDPSSATLSPEQEKQYQDQVKQLEAETAQTRIQLAQKVTEERRGELDKQLEDIRRANDEAESLIQRNETDQVAGIREQQLSGNISEEDASAQIEQVRSQSIAQETELVREQIAEIASLRAQGLLTAEEAAEKELELQEELSDLNLSRIEQELQAREAAKRRIISDLEEINQRAQAVISQSQNEQVAGIRQSQLNGLISEQEAAAQIERVQADVTAQTLAQKQEELAQIQDLRDRGVLTAREAADREISINEEIGRLNIQRIEAEIQARRRAAEEAVKQQFDQPIAQLEFQQQTRQSDSDLANVQVDLQGKLAEIEQQRLNYQIQAAENAGQSIRADRLRQRLYQSQVDALERQTQAQLAQQQIQEDIKRIELERNQLNAQRELALAQARSASQAELANLQSQVQLANDAIAQQGQLNQLERDRLALQQQQTQEQLEQNRTLEEQQRRQERISNLVSALTSSGGETDEQQARANLDQAQERFQLAQNAGLLSNGEAQQFREALNSVRSGIGQSDSSLLRNTINSRDNPFQQELLGLIGRQDIADLAGLSQEGPNLAESLREANSGVEQRLDTLNAEIRRLADSPRTLIAQTPDPVGDVAKMANQVSAQRMAAAGL